MKTLRLPIDPDNPNSESARIAIDTAAAILRDGGLVAFPTETVYGLGANALSCDAVEKIFIAKQRPAWDPVIVHIVDSAMLASVAQTPASEGAARKLMDRFWPGPLTLLLPKTDRVPPVVTAGRPLVGVRMPAHPVARKLIDVAGIPVAAPSANSFGCVSPTLAAHVLQDLDGRIDAVLDAGETNHGLESTVVDASQNPVVLYRPGAISTESIRAVCGDVIEWKPTQPLSETPPESLPSPGAGIRHYAPTAHLVAVEERFGPAAGALASSALYDAVREAGLRHSRVGVLLPEDHPAAALIRRDLKSVIFDWGRLGDPEQLAHRLFAGLRSLDQAGVEIILCPLPSPGGIRDAIRDRLLKAAKLA